MIKLKEVKAFQTTDGKTFIDKGEALYHQSKIDVIEKVKKSNFYLTPETTVNEIMIDDLSIIIELANIIKQSETKHFSFKDE